MSQGGSVSLRRQHWPPSARRDVLETVPLVLRYIARSGGRSFLYGTDPLTACQARPKPAPTARAVAHSHLCTATAA